MFLSTLTCKNIREALERFTSFGLQVEIHTLSDVDSIGEDSGTVAPTILQLFTSHVAAPNTSDRSMHPIWRWEGVTQDRVRVVLTRGLSKDNI